MSENRTRLLRAAGIPMKDIRLIIAGALRETKALTATRAFVDSKAPGSSFLVMSGPPGCGKTTAASWAVAATIDPCTLNPEAEDVCSSHKATGIFCDVAELARVSRYRDSDMRRLERARLLVIDDLGMEFLDEKGSFQTTLDGLVNSRYASERKTIIATNATVAVFGERYGERVLDRLREAGKFIGITAKSMRGAQ